MNEGPQTHEYMECRLYYFVSVKVQNWLNVSLLLKTGNLGAGGEGTTRVPKQDLATGCHSVRVASCTKHVMLAIWRELEHECISLNTYDTSKV